MRAAYQVHAVLAQQLARSSIEWHRKMSAEVSIRHDRTAFVAKEQRLNRLAVVVVAELRRAHVSGDQLIGAAYPNLHGAQSLPGFV